MLICVVYAHKGPTMEIINLFYSILFYQLSLLEGYRRNLSRTFVRHDCHRRKSAGEGNEVYFFSISA